VTSRYHHIDTGYGWCDTPRQFRYHFWRLTAILGSFSIAVNWGESKSLFYLDFADFKRLFISFLTVLKSLSNTLSFASSGVSFFLAF
jgi:hypothetical protein